MKPVKQTILHDEQNGIKGNCFTACIASIMELPIDKVPYFASMGEQWAIAFWDFLEEYNWDYKLITDINNPPIGYSIACGTTIRETSHSCIAYFGKVIFDPHPSNTGLKSINYYYKLYEIETPLKNLCENNKVE